MFPLRVVFEAIFIGLLTMLIGLPSGMVATKVLQYVDKSHEPHIQNNYNEYKSSGIYFSFLITGFVTYLVVSLIKRGIAGEMEGSVNVCGVDIMLPTSSLHNREQRSTESEDSDVTVASQVAVRDVSSVSDLESFQVNNTSSRTVPGDGSTPVRVLPTSSSF